MSYVPPARRLSVSLAFVFAAALAHAQSVSCPDFGPGALAETWRLRFFGGGGSTDQEYDTADTLVAPYRLLRDATEDLLITVRAGVRAEISNAAGLAARFGLAYHGYRSTTRGQVGIPVRAGGTAVVVTETLEFDNRHHTLAPTLGVGFHRWLGRVAPYVYADVGYELRVETTGALNVPRLPDPQSPDPFTPVFRPANSEPLIARAPGFQYGGTVGLDLAVGRAYFVGGSVSYVRLAGLDGEVDLLRYRQTALSALVNVGRRF